MSISKWKTKSSEYLVKKPWATLRVDECELPDGRIASEYYVLEYPNWANAVAITENNEIIMVKQYRNGADLISLEIPGGVIDGDEDPLEAVRRELLEETGYEFKKIVPTAEIYANPATSNNKTFSFLATGGVKVKDQSLDEHEDIEILLYSIDEIKQLLLENKIPQALHVTSLMYALLKTDHLNF